MNQMEKETASLNNLLVKQHQLFCRITNNLRKLPFRLYVKQLMLGRVLTMQWHLRDAKQKNWISQHQARGHSTDVERLERRQVQQEKALKGFSVKIEKQQMLGHVIQNNWTHVESLLTPSFSSRRRKRLESSEKRCQRNTLDSIIKSCST